ncbi:MAG: NADH:flavin oxidoreductase [Rhodospirillales bacterium]|nr:NADH:flavin oxidoreductase [Rhodospirillales bacterium]MBL6940650.1 NADH:flavin oxidoreductase [Rhodospirillales bacterium]
MTSNDVLLQPYTLKHLTIKNRIMSSAHEPAYSEDGMPKDRYRLYHLEKARGGIGLNMTAGSAIVSPDSPAAFGNLHAYKDEIVPWLKSMVDDCHELGTAMMIQLTHLGRRTNWNKADWLPVLAPSPVREPAHRAFPKQAEDWDLERIAGDYGRAAARMQAAGMDGIEIEAYGHLMDGFWSPATNKRDDDLNGSLENRLKFTHRVLASIRDAVGPDFIVGVRMVADENWDKGLSRDEGVRIAQILVAAGQVDFLNIIRGHIETDAALSEVIPVMGMASAPHLDFAGEVRSATWFPVFHAAKISDVATARHAIAEGKVDMVGMTRAHIADPHIAAKVAAGQEDDIRPCVGATYCLDRIYEGHEALCIHNPATGREATMPHTVLASRSLKQKCVIVGAGPGGLEAARVLGLRGHEVVVFEAADNPGGQVLLAAQSKRRRELVGIIDWRVAQCEKLDVSIRTNTWAEAPDVLAENPDIVIIATGGMPNTEFLEAGDDLAVTTWDIISGAVKPAENVLLFDDNGGQAGLQCAEFIAEAGSKLEIVTPERFFAPDVGGLNHVPYARCFQQHDVTITINHRLNSIRRDGNGLVAVIGSDYSDLAREQSIDQVVVEHGTLPLDDLYFDLKDNAVNQGAVDYDALIVGKPQTLVSNPDGAYRLLRIGDAVASRNIHAAIYDALRLCKDL